MTVVGTMWNLEPLPSIGLLASGILYAMGVHRLRLRGRSWPWTRSLPFGLGLLALAAALLSPIAAEDTRLFSAHSLQHMLLTVIASPLLCLGAPITLYLQASNRTWQERGLRVLHSRVIKVLTFPIVTWMIFVGTLFVLYFSGLYEMTLENRWLHDLMHLHFVMAGFLFFSAVVAIDPHPWRMPHGLRMLYVGLTLPAHAFLALALVSATTPIAADFYTSTTGRSLETVLTDQKFGAALMWIIGDFLSAVWVGIIVLQWVKADERNASREDKIVDDEVALHTGSSV